MSQPPPLPIDYSSRQTPQPPLKFQWRNFFLAFAIGTVISAIVWIGGADGFKSGNIVPFIIILPLVKLGGGITMVCMRKWRSAGIGLLLSIVVGFGIFFSVCAGSLDFK